MLMKGFVELAVMMQDLESEKESLIAEPAKLDILWNEMIQMCLWYVLQQAEVGRSDTYKGETLRFSSHPLLRRSTIN